MPKMLPLPSQPVLPSKMHERGETYWGPTKFGLRLEFMGHACSEHAQKVWKPVPVHISLIQPKNKTEGLVGPLGIREPQNKGGECHVRGNTPPTTNQPPPPHHHAKMPMSPKGWGSCRSNQFNGVGRIWGGGCKGCGVINGVRGLGVSPAGMLGVGEGWGLVGWVGSKWGTECWGSPAHPPKVFPPKLSVHVFYHHLPTSLGRFTRNSPSLPCPVWNWVGWAWRGTICSVCQAQAGWGINKCTVWKPTTTNNNVTTPAMFNVPSRHGTWE